MKSLHTFTSLFCVLLFTRVALAVRIPPSAVLDRKEANTTTSAQQQRFLRDRKLATPPKANTPDDHLVKNLPLLAEDEFTTDHWAGHLPASPKGDKFFFYWLFAPDTSETTKDDADIPLIIWLNGGPGCSSMDGLFLENGPFRLVPDQNNSFHLKAAPHSWHKAPAYTVYIDQPVGTGLSYTTSRQYPRSDLEVNVDFYYFLQSFFSLHADKFANQETQTVTREIYFSGESHAGHYIPHMMNYILQQNDNPSDPSYYKLNLAGAAIGNGWVEPYYQYAAARAAYGKALIDNAQLAALDVKEATCRKLLKEGRYNNGVCYGLLDTIVDDSYGSSSRYKVSIYDARKKESRFASRDFPPGHKVVETYLGGHGLPASAGTMEEGVYKLVLQAIHAETVESDHEYQECTDPPYNALSHQDGKGVIDDVVAVLEHPDQVRLLFFNGVEDLICNHVGNEELLENLPWKYKREWTEAKRFAWTANGEQEPVSGYMKEYENLMFLKVLNAGHMVPMDVPTTALEMMRTFVSKDSFGSDAQNLDRAVRLTDTCHQGEDEEDENS